MLLSFYVNLCCCTTSFNDGLSLHENSDWRHGFTAAWQSGGAAGATHVQISWISAWIPSEVTRTFFFDLPIWDSNSSSFSCRSFSSQREPTVVGSMNSSGAVSIHSVNTLRPRQNGCHFPDDIFKWIFLNENVWISITISLKFVPRGPINNIPTLVQVMAWRRPGDKPLSEPMMVRLPTHICVTRRQWVKYLLCWTSSYKNVSSIVNKIRNVIHFWKK